MQVRGLDEKIQYEQVQKRFYAETNSVMYEDWKIDIHDLLFRELLTNGKKNFNEGNVGEL